ncbi:asparagine synthase-related protein [Roseateles sp. BYS78W]|uniref:asparagine synthase (glutamine-hydrolyzing) n=1 Tax=Pelomonas candidula TaxID=3299025 RepID=A0ABW7HKN2_9BURK
MFRYVAFGWNLASQEQSGAARRLDQVIGADGRWQSAFKRSNLRVYVTGTTLGVNDVYLLPRDQGAILGHLFRRHDATPLGPAEIELSTLEAERIVHSDGRSLVDDFWGRYIAFLPSRTGEPRVLRDPTGTLPCFRIETQGLSIFSSELEDVLSLLDIPPPPVDWNAVTAHLLLGRIGGRETALEGISQHLGGELASMLPANGKALPLWHAVNIAGRAATVDPADAARRLREATARCVQSWAACYPAILLRLSGGVDSSIVLGNLCPAAAPERVTCLNYHSPGSDSDERAYARLAAQRAGTALVERPLDEGFQLEDLLNAVRTPCPAHYIGGMGSRNMDVEVALAHGASAIFTGTAGDQTFYEFPRTWPAADYLKDHGWDLDFIRVALDSAQLGRVSFWASVRQAITDRSFRGRPGTGAGSHLTLMASEAKEHAARTVHRFVHPGLLDAADLPIGKFHQVSALIHSLDYHNPYRNEASPELVHPLASQPLLEVSLETPTYVLTRGGRGRALARRAFADVLPSAIAARRSKGGMESYAVTALQRNLDFARELLLDGQLVRRGLLDRKRVSSALSDRPSANAAYVAEVHTCIATELWVQRMTTR